MRTVLPAGPEGQNVLARTGQIRQFDPAGRRDCSSIISSRITNVTAALYLLYTTGLNNPNSQHLKSVQNDRLVRVFEESGVTETMGTRQCADNDLVRVTRPAQIHLRLSYHSWNTK